MVALCWMTNNLASWRLQAGLYRESHTCTPRHLTTVRDDAGVARDDSTMIRYDSSVTLDVLFPRLIELIDIKQPFNILLTDTLALKRQVAIFLRTSILSYAATNSVLSQPGNTRTAG
jgi:hypothetical protein